MARSFIHIVCVICMREGLWALSMCVALGVYVRGGCVGVCERTRVWAWVCMMDLWEHVQHPQINLPPSSHP